VRALDFFADDPLLAAADGDFLVAPFLVVDVFFADRFRDVVLAFCFVLAVRFLAAPMAAPETAPIKVPTTGAPTAVPATAPATAPPSVLPAVPLDASEAPSRLSLSSIRRSSPDVGCDVLTQLVEGQ
jgi:hypothetical protein